MKNSASLRRFASPRNAPRTGFQPINELAEEENQPDEMAFEETKI
jgi:hypothetical protein